MLRGSWPSNVQNRISTRPPSSERVHTPFHFHNLILLPFIRIRVGASLPVGKNVIFTSCPVTRPQPLSTVAKRSTNENVLSRAAFIKNVLTKIEEVWIGKDATPEPSPLKRCVRV